jgi:flavin reductase (DIM6/NTAB) family NADH-FMN oxidoreductase RutF
MSSKAAPDQLVPVDTWLYRRACAQFTTGITVVTVLDSHGHPHGMTVNSFSSVSLDPPLVLVSIDLRNAILGHFISSSWFVINILAEHQEHLSRRFSSTAENRFIDVNWHAGASGTPVLEGVLAHLECSVVQTFEAGDHTVLIGEVRRASYVEGNPLVYFNSGYKAIVEKE